MGQAKKRGNFAQRQGEAITKKIMENSHAEMSVEELLKRLPPESKTAFNNLQQIIRQRASSIPLRIPSSKIWDKR